jgi:RimJ/RimL family protein N-acetyltransferase
MGDKYLFTSQRLGFRQWTERDIEPMAAINADPEVMEFFPATKTLGETCDFISRMQAQFIAKGFCYWAVDVLQSDRFIGFIGLSEQSFLSPYTPCTDIGWRLATAAWHRGYATEGAQRCLSYGFESLKLNSIKAIAPAVNRRSIAVMTKAGMTPAATFSHPLLLDDERLRQCVVYERRSSAHLFL